MTPPTGSGPRGPFDHQPGDPLFADLYELTMLAGYFARGLHEREASFDLFFRRAPFEGAHAVFAGLETVLEHLERLRFSDEHLAYLESLGLFRPAFLEYLRGWRFTATVTAVPEGRAVFPHEPLLTVTGALGEAQVVETALLNLLNFQTLVATKASRCAHQAAPAEVVEFGMRRAQGPDGALAAARAAYVGGATGTSNLAAGRALGIPVVGTHAHSWVQAFGGELEAFRAYAEVFPDRCVLLLDTYDTLESGLPNALTVARELAARGHRLAGVRLDSGDLAYLSRRVRAALDDAGFGDARVVASNDLDEHVIESVRAEGGRVDVYGVGTRLATGGGPGGGALGGVYKLVELGGSPRMKLTSDREKSSIPGRKRLWRATGPDGGLLLDAIALDGEDLRPGDRITDPANPLRRSRIPDGARLEDLRTVVLRDGRRTSAPEPLEAPRRRAREDLARLPEGTLRLLNPHVYRVGLSDRLHDLRETLIRELENGRG